MLKEQIIFLGPIWSHYRDSLTRSIHSKHEKSKFFGASNYWNNKPLKNNAFVQNIFDYCQFSIFGHKFFYFKNWKKTLKLNSSDKIVLTGFDPHMLHIILIVFYLRLLKRHKFYWWSHGTMDKQGVIGNTVRKCFYKQAEKILCYSKDGASSLLANGIKKEKVFVINNCLNIEDYGYLNYDLENKKTVLNKSRIHLLLSGKLNKEKNISILIKAVSRLKKMGQEIQLNIIGMGPQFELLNSITINEGLEDSVTFHGELYGFSAHEIFLRSDIFIIPGAVGLSILHGFSFGLPIITTNRMELHRPEIELLKQNVNGFYFQEGSEIDLAKKILKVFDLLRKDKNEEIKKACLDTIEEHGYLPKIVSTNILNALK